MLTGVAAGDVTITATWHGQSATSDVAIVSTVFAAGTTLWSNPPILGEVDEVVRGAFAPDGTRLLYAVEREDNTSVLRAFDPEGQETWAQNLEGRVEQLSGDPLGGAVVLLRTNPTSREVRTFAPDGRSAVVTAADSPGFAIHPDGPLYAAVGQQLKAFDIGLGSGRTVALPAGTADTVGGIPTVLADGSVVLPMRVTGGAHSPGESLDLLWMKPDGAVDVFPVDRDPTSFFQSFTVWPHKAIPNGLGGVLVTYDIRYYFAFAYHEARLRLVNADGSFGGWSAMGGTSTLGSWGPRLGRDGGDLVLGEEWVKATSYRTIGTTTVARITDFTRDGHAGLDGFLDGVELPEFTALEGGEFFASYADGSTSGPDPDHTSVQLANAIYTGGGSFFGSAEGAVTSRVGGALEVANTEWAAQAGGQQSANSTDPIVVDNRLGIDSVLIKLDDCEAGFRIIPAGATMRAPVTEAPDGVKPSAWPLRDGVPYSQDWYKVVNQVGVEIHANGEASALLLPGLIGLRNYVVPTCNFDGICRSISEGLYHSAGGRKLEPEWSQQTAPWHPDWRYPGPAVRKGIVCQ